MNKILIIGTFLMFSIGFSQSKEELKRDLETNKLLYKAQKEMQQNKFSSAEANYRKAIAADAKKTEAKYNLANAYYANKKNTEAAKRYIQATESAKSKEEKHKIYHNLGNVFMNQKQYKAAVESYKNALRNNPKDDETRYNLALAKKMLEEQGDDGGQGDDDKEEEQDDEQKEGENNEDQNQGENQNDNPQNNDDKNEKESPQDQGQQSKEDQQSKQGAQKPLEGKLSPQQIQSLLEAMNNEEKKVQDKINAEKQKGVKTKSEKDW